MMPAIQRVNVDFTAPMLSELDQAAEELNVSRQAVIKTFLRHALDQRYLAAKRRAQRWLTHPMIVSRGVVYE